MSDNLVVSNSLHNQHLDVTLTTKEVEIAVREAMEIVKDQIEVIEPHVFQSGKYYLYILFTLLI